LAKKPATKKTAKKTAGKTAKKAAKKTAKKAARKPTARKSTATKAAEAAKPEPRKSTASKKKASKKSVSKKTDATPADATKPKKKAARTSTAKKAASKKPAAKKAPRKSTKAAAAEAPETGATETKPAAKGKGASNKSASKAKQPKPDAADAKKETKAEPADDKKSGRKGITIVQPSKKPATRGKAVSKYNPPVRPMLLGPGSKFNKPLIPSGPSAPKPDAGLEAPKSRRTKSPLSKSKLEKFRQLLLAKRAELLGDVVSMENEALRSQSGGLSNNPQHIAEQGSENYDQTLSLNLAAQDRKRIKEIDDALRRIEEGTYGLCELTNMPIPEERLEEIPWARHTIEAARQLERNWGPSS
jgi:RNA polymerase-binding protein DksA